MYGLWYINFGLIFISLILISINIFIVFKVKYYEKKIKKCKTKRDELTKNKWVKNGTAFSQFDITDKEWEVWKELNDKVTEYTNKETKLKDIFDNKMTTTWAVMIGLLTIIVALTLICILFPFEAKREANYFKAQKEYVEIAIENGEELENIAITQEIIKQNQWLAKAKASVETYGCFSMYYNINFSELTPIVISRE